MPAASTPSRRPVTVTIVAGERGRGRDRRLRQPVLGRHDLGRQARRRRGGRPAPTSSACATRSPSSARSTHGRLVTVLDEHRDASPVTAYRSRSPGRTGPRRWCRFGARCWGTETDAARRYPVVVDHDSYANGVEVVAGAEVQPLLIAVTNTFDAALLVVSKLVSQHAGPATPRTRSTRRARRVAVDGSRLPGCRPAHRRPASRAAAPPRSGARGSRCTRTSATGSGATVRLARRARPQTAPSDGDVEVVGPHSSSSEPARPPVGRLTVTGPSAADRRPAASADRARLRSGHVAGDGARRQAR